MNKSGIKPLGNKVLVLPDQIRDKTAAGVIVIPESQRAREEMAQIEGVVVEIGKTAWKDHGDGSPWCKPGDRIHFAKYAGVFVKGDDGNTYRVINDEDVVSLKEKAK